MSERSGAHLSFSSSRARASSFGPGALMVVVSAVCFSAKAVFAKLAYRYGADASTVLTLRMGFSLPFFAAAGWLGGRRPGAVPFTQRERWQLALLGSAGYYLASWLDFQGLTLISAGLERLILFLYPTLVILFNVARRGERISRRVAAALALCYGGVALVVWNDRLAGGADVAFGSTLVFASALAYAGYLVFSQPLVLRHGSTRVTSWILVATAFCALGQFALEQRGARLVQPWQVYALGGAIALGATVVPAFLLAAGMKRLGTSRASLIATVGPVSTLLLAYWLLDEPIGSAQLLGSALVLFGVWLVGAPRKRPPIA
jgi:drug/metabolite transporter (DMT)-like permease